MKKTKVKGFGSHHEEDEPEENQDIKRDQKLLILMDAFNKRFEPADDIREASDLLSSNELITMFEEVVKVDKDSLFDLLQAEGYQLQNISDRFVWLLKEKAPN